MKRSESLRRSAHQIPRTLSLLLSFFLALLWLLPAAALAEVEVVLRELTSAAPEALPPIPGTDVLPVQMVLDDDSAESTLGVGAVTASQFLWFSQFAAPGTPFELREIWVLFPDDPEISVGDAIDLVIYQDENGDPSDGASILLTRGETIQAADGNTFSVFELPEPPVLEGQSTLLLGVINRFVDSGASPPSQAAAFDTGASQGRSWLATWSGDAPDPPDLASAANVLNLDAIQPGNWMIRGFGVTTTPVAIPTLGRLGQGLFLLLLVMAGWQVLGLRPR